VLAMLAVPLLPAQMQGMSCHPAAMPLDDEVQGIRPYCRGNLPLPPSAVVKIASVEGFHRWRCALTDAGESRAGCLGAVGAFGCAAWQSQERASGVFLQIGTNLRTYSHIHLSLLAVMWRLHNKLGRNLNPHCKLWDYFVPFARCGTKLFRLCKMWD
jgi:hypothetical protein